MLGKYLRSLLPAICVLCRQRAHSSGDLCDACYAGLPKLKNACDICAIPLQFSESTTLNRVCASCLKNPPPYQKIHALFEYEEPISTWIMQLKFQKKLYLSRLLGGLLAEFVQARYAQRKDLPQIIIPVPLHQKRICQRGFNQALEIARPVAKQLQIPIIANNVRRIKNTAAQASLPSKLRYRNMQQVFISATSMKGYVVVIDDVVTTGTTVIAMCESLKKAGVEKIDIWTIARTVLK